MLTSHAMPRHAALRPDWRHSCDPMWLMVGQVIALRCATCGARVRGADTLRDPLRCVFEQAHRIR